MSAREIAELIVETSKQSSTLVPKEWPLIERFDVVGYFEDRLKEAHVDSMESFEAELATLMGACEVPKRLAQQAGMPVTVRLVVPFAKVYLLSLGGIDDHLRDLGFDVQQYPLPSEDLYATLVARVGIGYLQVTERLDVI